MKLPDSVRELREFASRDEPSARFIQEMREKYPVEHETDDLLVNKLEHRADGPYKRSSLRELTDCVERFLSHELGPRTFEVANPFWLAGGVNKIQMGFSLTWQDPHHGERREDMVVRLDPAESLNATSRAREFELLTSFRGIVPVPETFWVDRQGDWFPQPALIYEFVRGVTKPSTATTGEVSGLGTNFGDLLRANLAPQFMDHLAALHTFDHAQAEFTTMQRPRSGSTDAALWQLNRARRVWEEDRGEDLPLMEVAANWLERNLPELDASSVVHGDYRSGNFLYDEDSRQILAWLDWERAHIGDRHRDLAWTTNSTFGHYDSTGRTYYVCGLVPLDQFYADYEKASGLSVDEDRLLYYRILNQYQIIASTMATAYRVLRLGKSHQDVVMAQIRGMVPTVADELRRLLEGAL